jgi:hypothetical protein
MAINPDTIQHKTDRYFLNTTNPLLKLGNTKEHLLQEISYILQHCPPKLPFASVDRLGRCHRGLFLGPTALAYFFLLLSKSDKHPILVIEGKTPLEWCHAYLNLGQEDADPLFDVSCGISNPYLAFNTVYACAHNDGAAVTKVLSALKNLGTAPGHCEWLNGRAGALYLLRVIKKFLPTIYTEEIDQTVKKLIEEIMTQDPWVWAEREYLGTVHGNIGILTQIMLSDPSLAPRLEDKLSTLLDQQLETRNWPVVKEQDIDTGLIHFCHGAPGFIISLLAIRSYFPTLNERIELAIEKGRALIWEKGLLRKEPNLCHGIVGNALALEGERREHILACATPEKVREGISEGNFVAEDIGRFELLWGAAGRAWVWMDWEVGEGRVVLYSDV